MNRFDSREDLLRYLSNVFDIELNLYVQNQVLARMNNTYSRLGNAKKIKRPSRKESSVDIVGSMFSVGVVGGIISAVVAAVVYFNMRGGGFFNFINALWTGLVFGVIGMIAFGVTIGTIVGYARKNKDQRELDERYEKDEALYRKQLAADEKRVAKENAQKQKLYSDMSLMRSRIHESEKNLKEMYAYDVLEEDYRNIYAVSSIYGYLKKGRTHSLEFNAQTGDSGAYNIYENERRLDRIITNTEEIMQKLDQVRENQYVLADGLKRAEERINSLSAGVSDFIYSTREQLQNIENSAALTAYNTERTTAELGMLYWLTLTE